MKQWLAVLSCVLLATGCRSGTAPQELAQLRTRVSTLEAENAHLQGQATLVESERDQLRQQVNTLATDLAKAQASHEVAVGGAVALSENLVVVPKEVRPGEWIAVHVKNYPTRLLPLAGIALRGEDSKNLAQVKQLSAANVFLLPVPRGLASGAYQVVIGEAGTLGPGAKLDDKVLITVKAP